MAVQKNPLLHRYIDETEKEVIVMKKIVSLFLALLLLATAAVSLADETVLKVQGSANVVVTSDIAVLSIGSTTKAESPELAQTQNETVMNAIIQTLKQQGIEEKDIVTSNFNFYIEEGYGTQVRSLDIGKKDQYVVTNMLDVTVRDLTKVGKVISAATLAGANQMYGLNFASTQSEEAYLKALRLAFENAQKKAQVLAEAQGKTLGKVTQVEESPGYYGGYYQSNNWMLKDEGSAAIISGDTTVSATVLVEFELQ